MSERMYINHLQNRKACLTTPHIGADTIFLPHKAEQNAQPWQPVAASIASRRPALRSRGSCRGWIIDPTNNREIVFESNLERGLAEMLCARRDISQVVDQPPAVDYTTSDGLARRHVFDFLAITTGKQRIAIAVKPATKVQSSGIETVVSLIEKQVGNRFADRYVIRTEAHITRDRVFNARLILRSRNHQSEDDQKVILALVPMAASSTQIAALVNGSGLGARGFNAIIGLIDLGILRHVAHGRIDYASHVSRCITN